MEKQLIYGKIAKVMAELEPIAKDRKNTQQNYSFRGVDDLMNAISPKLTAHGIFPVTFKVEDISSEGVTSKSGGTGWRIVRRYTFRFFAEDGSFVDTTADGEAIDYGDKASNKAYSVAYREAMFKMFVIPFQNEDIEEASHEVVAPKAAASAAKPAAKPAPAKQPAPPSLEKQRIAYEKRIKQLIDEIEMIPFATDEEYVKAVAEHTGLDFKPENYLAIGKQLAEIALKQNGK
jgi:hypothetical protein